MKIKRVNLGEIVREKVEAKGWSKAKFSEYLGIARQNVEKTIFQKHSLDSDMICNISEVLGCNLFDYFIDQDASNEKDYKVRHELKAKLTIELGEETQDRTYKFVFGENKIEIK